MKKVAMTLLMGAVLATGAFQLSMAYTCEELCGQDYMSCIGDGNRPAKCGFERTRCLSRCGN